MAESYKAQLVNYFKKNLAKGYTADALKFALMNQSYSRAAIDLALEQANKEMAAKAPVLKEKPVIRHEIIGENDQAIVVKKSWWRRLFGL